jgi:hypothetical protein
MIFTTRRLPALGPAGIFPRACEGWRPATESQGNVQNEILFCLETVIVVKRPHQNQYLRNEMGGGFE